VFCIAFSQNINVMISKTTIDKIHQNKGLVSILETFVSFKKKGNNYIGDCPFCTAKNKFNIQPKKQIYKCFSCDQGGNNPIKFLMDYQQMTYPQAIEHCAKILQIEVDYEVSKMSKDQATQNNFRDQQLRQSGIEDALQIAELANGKTINRFQQGSLNQAGEIQSGSDMVLNFIDLDGMPMTYLDPETHNDIPFRRVRLAKPKSTMKYWQPKGSGSHLWLPEYIREAYQTKKELHYLVITEGEKKASKLCAHGIPAVGIMGIHNLSFSEKMSHQFKLLIQHNSIHSVVFLLDKDWQDLSIKPNKRVDSRPNIFYKAVLRFRNYFFHYQKDGIGLDTYFGYLKTVEKGADDLLIGTLKGQENLLQSDIEMTLIDRQGKGEYVNLHKITSTSEYNIKKYWKLHNMEAFVEHHQETLNTLSSFIFGKREYELDEEGNFKSIYPLEKSEQFWIKEIKVDKSGDKKVAHTFLYRNLMVFLKNRNIGKMFNPLAKTRLENDKIIVRTKGKTIEEITHRDISSFVHNFVEEIGEYQISEMLIKGIAQYFAPEKLMRMHDLNIQLLPQSKHYQYLIFKDKSWRITKEKITQLDTNDLPGYVWKDKIIDKTPILHQPMIEVTRENGAFQVKEMPFAHQSDIANYLKRASDFEWEDQYELVKNEYGLTKWQPKSKDVPTQEMSAHQTHHFVCKMIGIGYLLHDYTDRANAKAIICMDGKEAPVGQSNGGTGKSLLERIIEEVVPLVHIDGKKHDMSKDNFLYDQVNGQTQVICIDDCRTNIDFEQFFSQITNRLTVNVKFQNRFDVDPPKFLLTTNHAINGDDASTIRRQYYLAFSDWYNLHRKPTDDFGRRLFDDWNDQQWMLFYNFVACCIQTYLRFGLAYEIPKLDLYKRRLRQSIGENFLEWADLFYAKDAHVNEKLPKLRVHEHFLYHYPEEKKYCNIRSFKKKLIKYAAYRDLTFNPIAKEGVGKDIKSNGIEYFVLGDANFDAIRMKTRDWIPE